MIVFKEGVGYVDLRLNIFFFFYQLVMKWFSVGDFIAISILKKKNCVIFSPSLLMNPNLWGDTGVSLHCLTAKQAEWALYFLNGDCSQWLSDHNVPLYWTELIYGTLLIFFTLDQWWHRESCEQHQLEEPQRWIVPEGPCGVWATLDADWNDFCVDSQHSDHGLPEFTCFFRSMDTTASEHLTLRSCLGCLVQVSL